MKKDIRFLDELEEKMKIVKISSKNRKIILLKYRELIDEEKSKGRSITKILKDFGSIDEIAKKEASFIKKNRKKSNFVKESVSSITSIENTEIVEEQNKVIEENPIVEEKSNEIIKVDNNDTVIKNKNAKLKQSLEKIKQSLNNTNKKLNNKKTNIKKKISDKKLVRKEKKELKKLDIDFKKDKIKNNIVEEKAILEDNITKNEDKNLVKQILLRVLLFIVILFWLVSIILFFSSLFAVLDGVKFYGINLCIFSFIAIFSWMIIFIRKLLYNKKINRILFFVSILAILLVLGFGVSYTVHQFSKVEIVKDVSEKYSMTRYYKVYTIPNDSSKKYYIRFNSNYKTSYDIEYDKSISNQVKVEVKYYENYYDFFVKENSRDIYISLSVDDREKLSSLINDWKENKYFDKKELSRYTVKITMNENDKDRVFIE